MSLPYNGRRFTFHQPDGTTLDVRGWGDQHHAVFETLDGDTVVRDPQTGYYCFAEISPDGETYRFYNPESRTRDLHHRSGGSADNIVRTFDEESTPALAGLRGEPVTGDWTLRLSDREAADVGKLDRWSLRLFRQG